MRIAVCDDDEREISNIKKLIIEYQVSREESMDCHYFSSGVDFLCELRGGEYDLIFLDVLMPGVSGIQAAQELRELDKNVRLIFVSASPEFAVESYSVGAYYYLLKPIDKDAFFELLDKIGGELSAQMEQGFTLKSREGIVRIAFTKLMYVEVMNKTVSFHLADGDIYEATATLADFEGELLSRPEFLKTHRSYLVNLGYIQSIDINCVTMKNGQNVPVSRKRRGQVRDTYMSSLHQTGECLTKAGTKESASIGARQARPEGPWRILLVDDDPSDRCIWEDILRSHGCIVGLADCGEDALRIVMESYYDCVLLDVMIPGEDGFSICERLHQITNTPVIFLSCLTEPDKQLKGFAAGGIDYITKDTPASLFWAKVKTHIRLTMSECTQMRYGPLVLDLTRRRALIHEKELPLTSIEFDILCRLTKNPEHVFTPKEIYGMIWGNQPWDGGQLVQAHMSKLRRQLEKAWPEHRFVETVWGQGYRFVPVKSKTP